MTCTHVDGVVICHTPMRELARRPDGVRWCFGCRAHLAHDIVVLATVEPSYYDPHAVRECSRCGKDRTDFPGRTW